MLRQRMNESRKEMDEIRDRIVTLKMVLEEDAQARANSARRETLNQIMERRRAMLPQPSQQQPSGEHSFIGLHMQKLLFSPLPLCQLRQAYLHRALLEAQTLEVVTVVRLTKLCCMLLSCWMLRQKD